MLACVRNMACAVAILLSVDAACATYGFTIVPNAPTAGQNVSVSFTSVLCHIFPEVQPAQVTQSGSLIEVRIPGGLSFPPICTFPLANHLIPFGNVPAGQYTVAFIGVYSQPPPFDQEVLATLPLTIGTIGGGALGSTPVPTLSAKSIIALMLTFGCLGALAIRRNRRMLAFVLLLGGIYTFPTDALAQEQRVIVSHDIQVLLVGEARIALDIQGGNGEFRCP